jgi:hypothetical protein
MAVSDQLHFALKGYAAVRVNRTVVTKLFNISSVTQDVQSVCHVTLFTGMSQL